LDNNKLVMEFMDSLQKDNNIPEWQIRNSGIPGTPYLIPLNFFFSPGFLRRNDLSETFQFSLSPCKLVDYYLDYI
jgi:hypothetical protein